MSYVSKLKCFAKSDIGLFRKNNEDVFATMPDMGFFVLADGMGGHRAGEVAAEKAVEHMCSSIRDLTLLQPALSLKEELSQVIQKANERVHFLSSQDPKLHGMGTTICSVLFHEDRLVYSHVGDSRLYRLRGGELSQLTSDHSFKQPIRHKHSCNQGEPTYRKVLTKAVGTSPIVTPDVGEDIVYPGDTYLLCSDGLSDPISDRLIQAAIYQNTSLEKTGDTLIRAAKTYGGHDNITLVLIRAEL